MTTPTQPEELLPSRKGYIPPSWRDPIGKPLTDHRITHYQRLGLLGGSGLLLPPVPGPRCQSCNGTKNVRHYVVTFLPCGNYCLACYENARDSRDKDRELTRLVRQQRYMYE